MDGENTLANHINYLDFEEALDKAFPLRKDKAFDWSINRVAREAHELCFLEKNWREAVGFQISLLDCSFSHNLELFPMDAMTYYLPSFLLSAAMELHGSKDQGTYPAQIADGFLLAIPDTVEKREEVDNQLSPYGLVSSYPNGRINLYRALNPEQRRCVAMYLRLYWADYCEIDVGYVNEGRKTLFQEIVNTWDCSNF
jgi:hypothetical protein